MHRPGDLTIHLLCIWTPEDVGRIKNNGTRCSGKTTGKKANALVFSVIHYGLSRSQLPQTPRSLELFLSPLSSNQPRLSQTLLQSRETLVDINQEVQSRHLLTRSTESREMYCQCVHGKESNVRLTGLAAGNAEVDKLPVFVNFRDQTITPEIWSQPHYLESPLSWTNSNTLGSST